MEAVAPCAAPSPSQKGTKVGVSCCGAEALGGGLEAVHVAVCSCWGCSPVPTGCPLSSFNVQGSYQRGRLVWERCLGFVLVPHLRAETSSVGREPLSHADTPVFGEAPHLITGSVFAAQVPHFVFYAFWYPLGAFPGFGGVTSDLQLVSHEV